MAFLGVVTKEERYSVCVYQLKALKSVINEVENGQKAKSKVQMIFVALKWHKKSAPDPITC